MTERDLIAACREDLALELQACAGQQSEELFNMIRYHLGWVDANGNQVTLPGGKMLRPTLCLLSCHSLGGDYRVALPAAASIELMHNFSLIHDDIQDRSSQRRHRPTVWRVWGEAQAINAGNGLHVLAHLAHLRLAERGAPPGTILATVAELDRACLELCQGQYLDIRFESETHVSLDAYLTMIGKKTARLFEAATRIGAMLGKGDRPGVQALGLFGRELGLAFQIEDDILGIWGIEKHTGKPCLDDIRTKKKSLPIVHAMNTAEATARQVLEDALGADILDERDVERVLAVVEEAGSRGYCETLARNYWEGAWSRLETLSLDNDAKSALESLASSLIARAA